MLSTTASMRSRAGRRDARGAGFSWAGVMASLFLDYYEPGGPGAVLGVFQGFCRSIRREDSIRGVHAGPGHTPAAAARHGRDSSVAQSVRSAGRADRTAAEGDGQ